MSDGNPLFSATGSWLVPQQAHFLAILQRDGHETESEIRAVRRLGLSVVVDATADIQPGEWIDTATMLTEAGPLALRFLQVQVSRPDAFGTLLELRTDDPRSLADLWAYLYERRSQAAQAPAASADRNYEELKIPREGPAARAAWLRDVFGQDFPHVLGTRLDAEALEGNIENFVGAVEIPVGLAGPLLFHGRYARGMIHAPLATTEGALVASINRGARAVTSAGGVTTHVIRQRMVRAPAFVAADLPAAIRLYAWINDHAQEIRNQTAQVGRHANLVKLDPVLIGRNVHLRFVFETGDAAGQNLSTLATWRACQWIQAQISYLPDIRVDEFFVEANLSGDKKATPLNYVEGRGIAVTAEVLLPPVALHRLRVEPDALLHLRDSAMSGSLYTGMLGANANFANAIAAIFTATGQDIAAVHESSVGQFHLERWRDGIRAYLLLPNLVVGSVGGGTRLPAQRECLDIMGAYGRAKAGRLAEIIAGYCLALDLSTMAAIAAGHFAEAHEKLGRRHRRTDRVDDSVMPELCGRAVRRWLRLEPSDSLAIDSVKPLDVVGEDSVMQDFASGAAVTGRHTVYEVAWRMTGSQGTSRFLVKSKPTDHEVIRGMRALAGLCGEPLSSMFEAHQYRLGFRNCHIRELAIAQLTDDRLTSIAPEFLTTWRDDAQGQYMIVMEFLEGVSHLNSARQPQLWKPEHIRAALRDIARFHAWYLDRTDELSRAEWMDVMTRSSMQELQPVWEAVLQYNAKQFPSIFTPARVARLHKAVERIGYVWDAIERYPRTLIHNDFNLRNVCLRHQGADLRLCAFDWELATIHVPQRDVSEFLSFVLPPGSPREARLAYVEEYRRELEEQSGAILEPKEFMRVFELASLDYALNRLGLLTIAQGINTYEFLPRVLHSHLEYLDGCDTDATG